MRKHRASSRSKKGFSSGPVRLLLFALLTIGVAATLVPRASSPFVSSEVKFADSSPSGLQIMPASCASSPPTEHWSGECSMPSSCELYLDTDGVTAKTIPASPSDTVKLIWAAPHPPDPPVGPPDSTAAQIYGTITGIGAVYSSGALSLAAPDITTTYRYDGGYKDSAGTTIYNFSCQATLTVNGGTNPLYISKVELNRAAGSNVTVGDIISYRMYVANLGSTQQNSVVIQDAVPAGTHLTWQGGGPCTDGISCNTSGTSGTNLRWNQNSFTASGQAGSSGYVDFNVMVDGGTEICNTATIRSAESAQVSSNKVCNPVVANCPTLLPPAIDNPEGYKVPSAGYGGVAGKRADLTSLSPFRPSICVRNSSQYNYFLPIGSVEEVDAFEAAVDADTVTGATYDPI